MSWGTFLAGAAAPLTRRVMSALGLGVVTIIGLHTLLTNMLQSMSSSVGSIGADLGALLALGGFLKAMSILAGALVTRVSMIALKRFEVL